MRPGGDIAGLRRLGPDPQLIVLRARHGVDGAPAVAPEIPPLGRPPRDRPAGRRSPRSSAVRRCRNVVPMAGGLIDTVFVDVGGTLWPNTWPLTPALERDRRDAVAAAL